MCGMQSLASATFSMRSQILPPAKLNSLYGSMTRSAVISLLKLQMCHGPGSYANSAGVASDPRIAARRICLVSGSPEFRRRGSDSTRRPPRDRSNSPSVLSPSSRSRPTAPAAQGAETALENRSTAGRARYYLAM